MTDTIARSARAASRPTTAERRRLVIVAATELADSGGYDAVAMKAVADRSGVALATIYRWFSSKDHLLAEAVLAVLDDLETQLRADPPQGATAADRVAGIMCRFGDLLTDHPQLASAVITALLSFDDAVVAVHDDFHRAIERWIDLAVGDDEVRDRATAIELMEHIMFSSIIQLVRGRDTADAVRNRLILASQRLLSP